jgi:hypothetical protein
MVPKFTSALEGKGLFWKYLWFCMKTAFYTCISLLGGIVVSLSGMAYLVYKLFTDFMVKNADNEINQKPVAGTKAGTMPAKSTKKK